MFFFYVIVGMATLLLLGIFNARPKPREIDSANAGIKGWLAIYLGFVWVYAAYYASRTVVLFIKGHDAAGTGFDMLAFVMLLFIASATLGRRRPFGLVVARTFHSLAILVVIIVLMTDRAEWVRWSYYVSVMVINAVWLAYLLRSRRVNATFHDEAVTHAAGVSGGAAQL
ncbi:MAG TPA: hypothetical protein VGL38_06430 [bacterium]